MCSYPRVNGQYACENQHLLEDVLKGDWGFNGLRAHRLRRGEEHDQLAQQRPRPRHLAGDRLPPGARQRRARREPGQRVDGRRARRAASCARCSRSASSTATPTPTTRRRIDQAAHDAAAGELEQEGIVLLENDGGDPAARRGRASASSRSIGPEADDDQGRRRLVGDRRVQADDAAAGHRGALGADKVVYDDGSDAGRARPTVAAAADVAVVVVGDRMSEGADKPCMGLNCGQQDGVDRDALIEAVAAAQPRTVVVLQTGGPVLTPWRDKVRGTARGVVPGPERRHRDRARAVRRRRARRPPAGDVPAAARRTSRRPATPRSTPASASRSPTRRAS